jgi:hypothetical protein
MSVGEWKGIISMTLRTVLRTKTANLQYVDTMHVIVLAFNVQAFNRSALSCPPKLAKGRASVNYGISESARCGSGRERGGVGSEQVGGLFR